MADSSVKVVSEREVRFAVVMYGGVSLAIYINGVAQELLNMVRATAPAEVNSAIPLLGTSDKDKAELAGSSGVYRKLGQYLASADEDDDWEWATTADRSNPPIRTRFVVDVISGTSAGGINGVFLAKALARNQKMGGLKQLWLSEGDLAKLLNDPFSVADLAEEGYTVQEPRQSLLNSQRMYRKLLEALAQMDESRDSRSVYDIPDGAQGASPLVSELDLFITTTDIEGLPLPMALADRVVYERRHRNVFHFRYTGSAVSSRPRDDFGARNDPFLAYAARCTSSFPFAFEPMRLQHINEVLESYSRYAPAASESYRDRRQWDQFFNEYLRPGLFDLDKEARGKPAEGKRPSDPRGEDTADEATARLRRAFQTRSFGDGGYLDNKPFSYATSMLMRRYADCEVYRKLLYIEPSPEHPELLRANPNMPDFAENVRAAVLDLPRRETIREDIERLYDRNQIVQRIATFGREVDADVLLFEQKEPLSHEEFCNARLGQMLATYGIGYGAYHRLKVAEITSFLAEVVTRDKGHDPWSDAGTAIRELVAAWRRDKYDAIAPAFRKNGDRKQTENQFLVEFDVRYRLRRIIFLLRRLNELLQLDPDRHGKVDDRTKRLFCAYLDSAKEKDLDPNVVESVTAALKSTGLDPKQCDDRLRIWLEAFVRELRRIKREALSRALVEARSAEEELMGPLPSSKQEQQEILNQLKQLDQLPALTAEQQQEKEQKLRELAKLEMLYELHALLEKLQLPWPEMRNILLAQGSTRSDAANQFFAQHSDKFDEISDRIQAFLAARRLDLKEALKPGHNPTADPPAPFPPDSEWSPAVLALYRGQGEKAARLCLINHDKNFLRYDMVTHPIEYGTGSGEANKVEVYRVSPEDAVALFDERRTKREKLAGRALMSFGAFLDKGWRKNDMLWGRLDGAERLICAILPLPEERKDESDKTRLKRERRNALIKEAHVAILKEEFVAGDIKVLCDLIGTTLGRCEPSSEEERKLRVAVEQVIDAQDLPATMRSVLYRCLDEPEKIWEYYNQNFTVNRQLEAETALRLISRATNITGKMLESLADKYGYDRGKRGAVWIARLGSVFWNTIAVAVPQSLANLFFRHWLGLLYIFSALLIFAGIAVSAAGALGWKFLGGTIALHLVTSLLGDFMAGSGRLLLAARIVLVVGVVAILGCGAYFIADKLSPLVPANEIAAAAIVAGIVLIARGAVDWRAALKKFRAAPHASFNPATLGWLTAATIALGLILNLIGPPGIAQLEFAQRADALNLAALDSLRPNLYLQLGVDFLFLISYTVMLAAYCVAGAKIFWQRLDTLERQTKSPGWHGKLLNWLVTIAFIMAGLQCLAGAADATENVGLLVFIRKHNESGLQLAYYCAFLKFVLVALGGLYSAVGLALGIAPPAVTKPDGTTIRPPRRWGLGLFALIGLLFFLFSWITLWCVPLKHQACCGSFLKTESVFLKPERL
jgi:patatin-related protein